MSRQVRTRVTALVLGGLLLGATLATTGMASAEPAQAGTRQVVFASGGMMGFPCRSQPSVESLTVPAESTVRLVNRTGSDARLLLNGASRATVPDEGMTEVMFRRGTTAVTLDPNCGSDQTTPVMVTASPAPSEPDVDPAPAAADPGELPADPMAATEVPSDSAPPVDSPAVPLPARPGRPAKAAPVQRQAPAGVVPAPALPHAAAQPHVNPGSRTGDSTVPVPPAMPLGGGEAVRDRVQPGEVPLNTTEAAPALGMEPQRPVAEAQPVAASAPMRESRPIGLLALVAFVSVIGVAAGAIRAIVSQRASRANLA
jgi:hypothetical protein